MLLYNGLLRYLNHPLPVRSIVVYLMHTRRAGVPRGIARRDGDHQVQLEYDVFCAWAHPVTLRELKQRPVLAPLAVLTPGIGPAEVQLVPQVLRRAGLPRQKLAELLALTYFMPAARFDPDLQCSFRRGATMLESAAYREVVAEGRAEGEARGKAEGEAIGRARGEAKGRLETLRAKLIKLVRHRLGRLPRGLPGKLEGISADRLDALFDRALETEDPRALRALLAALPSPPAVTGEGCSSFA